tara:strand:+ start:63309 stop:63560 length:252 start_codon:yes stop_codon:yes gene_type:complete
MAKYKIVYDRKNCTGVAACYLLAPKYWEMDEDDRANLVGSKQTDDDIWELEIDEADLPKNLEAARECPVKVIRILNESGEDII